jgi:hypothetical protein
VGQARLWAERTLSQAGASTQERIDQLYLEAFGRPPTSQECEVARDFVAENARPPDNPLQAWADLCHVLLNVKEFIFVR